MSVVAVGPPVATARGGPPPEPPADGPGGAGPTDRTVLVGRDHETSVLRRFLDDAARAGGALLLTGAPGVGRTALLRAAAVAAGAAGTRVLAASAVPVEQDVEFAVLHRLLLPLVPELDGLRPPHRAALAGALGFEAGPAPQRLVTFAAVSALLRDAAAQRPLLLVVDDLQWVDRSSRLALGSAARRLARSRVGLLGALRSGGDPEPVEWAGLPQLEVPPLDDRAAARVVRDAFPALAPGVARRVVAEARGNPLALHELPRALTAAERAGRRALPAVLPLGHRLPELVAPAIEALPAATRRLLLLASLDGTGDLQVLRAASGGFLDELAPAERAALVAVDDVTRRLVFAHPLVRSAVVALADAGDVRAAHATLAGVLADQPDRCAWHRAGASPGLDEDVARALEDAAHRAARRSDGDQAVAALTRAAELSPEPAARSRRLVTAAYLGADTTGDAGTAADLLDEARTADPSVGGSLYAAAAAALLMLDGEGDVDTAHRLLLRALDARSGPLDARDPAVVAAVSTLIGVSHHGGRSELWEAAEGVMQRLVPEPPVPVRLLADFVGDPVRSAGPALGALDAAIAALGADDDPGVVVRTSSAAVHVDRLGGCREALLHVVRHGRHGSAARWRVSALALVCIDDVATGRWDEGRRLAEEGLALSTASGVHHIQMTFQYVVAQLAALRGDPDRAEELADAMDRRWGPRRSEHSARCARHVRLLVAAARDDPAGVFRCAGVITPPGSFAPYAPVAVQTAFDLVEAAVRSGRHDDATAHVAAMQRAGLAGWSPRLALLVTAARALAEPDDPTAAALFEESLAVPGCHRWPVDVARVRLAYGERLHRARSSAAARQHLGSALEAFVQIGAVPWADRARRGLRAAGAAAGDVGSASLTPEEEQIAALAASGLTNRQIAEQLFLSHRTVGARLYRIFPKLGVTSRAALRDALVAHGPGDPSPARPS